MLPEHDSTRYMQLNSHGLMQVLGNAKGVVAAFVSIALFKNPVSFVGCAGYLLTVAGVVGYSQVRHSGLQL